ncbi:MAG TPA: glycosyltransferase family A protein [Pseudonocardiaceae bacterium]|nr:glycosyltransferase family A protein [Pseudonocardiaceae bacterium]
MVTRDRPAFAARAIRCFADQRYPARELIIVCQGTSEYRRHLAGLTREHRISDVAILEAAHDMSLGALRNRALDAASGDLVCIWDDDDCSHPDRLAIQVAQLIDDNSYSCFLGEHLQLFDRTLYWIDWELGIPKARYPLLPGTMLMTHDRRFRYPESGRYKHFAEDWALMTDLHRQVRVSYLRNQGQLYLYNYHGGNTFSAEHHAKLRIRSLTAAAIADKELIIRTSMAHFAIYGPLQVCGRDGPAFSIEKGVA